MVQKFEWFQLAICFPVIHSTKDNLTTFCSARACVSAGELVGQNGNLENNSPSWES